MGEVVNFTRHRLKGKSKHEIYKNAYDKKVRYMMDNTDFLIENIKAGFTASARDLGFKIIFYGVMTISTMPRRIDEKDLGEYKEIINMTRILFPSLKIEELLNMFPVEKTYDGEKLQCKDYYSTMKFLKDFDTRDTISNKSDEFLWHYFNWNLMKFDVNCLMFFDNMRMKQGEESIMIEFARKFGIDTFTMSSNGELIKNEYKPKLTVITNREEI